MEMSDGSQWLIREWETSDMEEAGLHRNTLLQFLHKKETRLQRMCHFVAVAIVLLIFLALALLIMAVYGRGVQISADSQPTMQDTRNLTVTRHEEQQLTHVEHPVAMLTVPSGKNTDKYLQWESKEGNAFCRGGFSYTNGSLVVPRKGMYRVFLQITYESKEGLECPSGRRKLQFQVLHWHDSYPNDMFLLSSIDTVSCDMEEWTKSLYTSGLFDLKANSRLRVQSSYPELILKKEYQVFFGAEFVSQ